LKVADEKMLRELLEDAYAFSTSFTYVPEDEEMKNQEEKFFDGGLTF